MMEVPRNFEASLQDFRRMILLVEDEWLLRATVSDILRDLGFEVAEAPTADEAVTMLCNDKSIRLVISDVRMPGKMDGIHLAAWIAQNRPGLPVILASGATAPGREVDAMRHADRWLNKPYDFAELERAVDEMLRTRRERVAQ